MTDGLPISFSMELRILDVRYVSLPSESALRIDCNPGDARPVLVRITPSEWSSADVELSSGSSAWEKSSRLAC